MLAPHARSKSIRALLFLAVFLIEFPSAFILEMQSGFFLQLILTLAALASRLDILVQDLADALRNSWTSMYKLFCALNVS